MRNIRLTLAYDGTDFVGWQTQPNGPSVQSAVEEGLRQFTGLPATLLAAGRTDAGVHALGQVASFRTESTIPCSGFVAGLQTYLPRTILILTADEVDLSFHATHAAKRKRYRYVIHNVRARHPFLRNYAYEFHVPLDEQAMHAAAQVLVGKHDFRAFESQYPNKASSVRTVFELSVTRREGWPTWDRRQPHDAPPTPGGEFIWIDIVANGFLYNMVRAIAGTLIRVGEGKWTAHDVDRILQAGERKLAGPTSPACGLYLVRVEYADATVSDGADSLRGVAADEARL